MSDTRTKILDLAEDLTQKAGFNGFSYLDLADQIGVKHASIHYHFKAKADLALALVERIRENHGEGFAHFDAQFETPKQRLRALIAHFKGYLKNSKFCMCGMMAAEFATFGPEVRQSLSLYFKDLQTWLAKQFSQLGHANPQKSAVQFLSALEGSLLLARLEDDPNVVDQALETFVTN